MDNCIGGWNLTNTYIYIYILYIYIYIFFFSRTCRTSHFRVWKVDQEPSCPATPVEKRKPSHLHWGTHQKTVKHGDTEQIGEASKGGWDKKVQALCLPQYALPPKEIRPMNSGSECLTRDTTKISRRRSEAARHVKQG